MDEQRDIRQSGDPRRDERGKRYEDDDYLTTHWSIDRKIPIALVLGLAFQLAAFVWYASALSDRVSHVEDIEKDQASQIATLNSTQVDRSERIAKLESNDESIKTTLTGVDRKIDAIVERLMDGHMPSKMNPQ
jgi:hypothetical protein